MLEEKWRVPGPLAGSEATPSPNPNNFPNPNPNFIWMREVGEWLVWGNRKIGCGQMETVAEGLWGLADMHEKKGEIGKAVKCLEALCQSQVSFLPILEIKTRLRIATLLLKHSHNLNHAKSHLERSVCSSSSSSFFIQFYFSISSTVSFSSCYSNFCWSLFPPALNWSAERIAYSASVTISWEPFLPRNRY